MQFFKNFQTFNEALDIEETTKKLDDVESELKKADVNYNKVLRKMMKVTTKSEVLSDSKVKDSILDLFQKLSDKLEKEQSSKKDSVTKDQRYINIKEFTAALENENNELAKKVAAEGKKLMEEEQKKAEAEEKSKKEGESSSETTTTDEKKVDAEKYKNLFANSKITTKSAPQLSITLAKQEVPEVKILQQFLMDKGYLQTSEAAADDGYFGEKTRNAVVEYQKEKGLTQDGVVGKNTWAAILSDAGMTPDADFKAFQLNQPAQSKPAQGAKGNPTTATKPEPAKADTAKTGSNETSDEVKAKYKELTGLEFGQQAPKMTIEQIVKNLTNERMGSATVPTDEKEVAKILINQINNGVLNQTTMTDLLNRYKSASSENEDGLVEDIIYAFDTDFTDINGTLSEMEPEKAKNSIVYDAIIGIGTAARWFLGEKFSDDTALAIAVFLAFASTKNNDVINAMKFANLNVAMMTKILNYKPATTTNA